MLNDKWELGKSSDQGSKGIAQGTHGYDAINPVINKIASANAGYSPTRITKSMLTKEGFQQGLDRITARNNAKLRLGQQRVLSGVLGGLLNARSSDARTAMSGKIASMDNATKMRGQDVTAGIEK